MIRPYSHWPDSLDSRFRGNDECNAVPCDLRRSQNELVLGRDRKAASESPEDGRDFVINVYGNERVEINNLQITSRQPEAISSPDSV